MRLRTVVTLALMVEFGSACPGKGSQPTTPAPTAGSATGSAPVVSPYPTKPIGPATVPLADAPGVKVTLADVGLEQSSLDRTADPCVDFYQFACGGWLANNPIPTDRTRWSRALEIEERTRAALHAILEDAAKGIGADAATKKLGDFYASCMDEASVERAGITALGPLLDRVTRVGRDARSWLAAISKLHEHGIWVVWRADARPDLDDATTAALYLHASGYRLPRATYVDPKHAETLAAYRTEAAKLLEVAAVPKPEAAAADVIAIETELAKLSPGAEADDRARYHPVQPKALARQARSIHWKTYWKALGVAPDKKLVVEAPRLFPSIDKLRTRFKPAQWASYFRFHALAGTALALPKSIAEPAFAIERLATGTDKPVARGKRCIAATEVALGHLLAQRYVAKHSSAQAKQTAATVVDAVARAVADKIARADWLSDPTRQAALAKLAKVQRHVAFPERWPAPELEVKREGFAGNLLRAAAAETRGRLARWGKPVERGEWQTGAFAVAVSYEPRTNSLLVPAGGLQPPVFGRDRSIAANLGGLGVRVGRELMTGVDERGGKWDDDGNHKPWWTPADLEQLAARARCVEAEYSGFEAAPKAFVDGKRTRAANIADMAGVEAAFKAYRALRKDAEKVYVADGYTEDQQFFIAVAQAWCTREPRDELQKRLATATVAPPKFRVYGSLRNMREFAEAFACAPGTPMNPAKTCSVW